MILGFHYLNNPSSSNTLSKSLLEIKVWQSPKWVLTMCLSDPHRRTWAFQLLVTKRSQRLQTTFHYDRQPKKLDQCSTKWNLSSQTLSFLIQSSNSSIKVNQATPSTWREAQKAQVKKKFSFLKISRFLSRRIQKLLTPPLQWSARHISFQILHLCKRISLERWTMSQSERVLPRRGQFRRILKKAKFSLVSLKWRRRLQWLLLIVNQRVKASWNKLESLQAADLPPYSLATPACSVWDPT